MTDRLDGIDGLSGSDGAIRAEYDWTATPASIAVIEMVAAACDTEPTQLGPLYEAVDPDALNSLVRSTGYGPAADGSTVKFEVADRSVTVHGDGAVVVRPVEPGLSET